MLFTVHTDQFSPPQRQISKPFRMCVSDVSKSMGLGQTVSGRVYAGAAAVGNSVRTSCYILLLLSGATNGNMVLLLGVLFVEQFLLMPVGLPLTIKGAAHARIMNMANSS